MNESLEKKIDLMSQNVITVRKSGKMDLNQAACLGALLFTQNGSIADEAKIRACRKILKNKVGMLSNFRGFTNLALLCKMAQRENPEAYLDEVLEAYAVLTANKKFRSESLVFAAEAMAEGVEKERYPEISNGAWDAIARMKFAHPLLTSQDDAAIATLLVMSNLDIEKTLAEAEQIYDRMKGSGFKFNKDSLQSISLILALSKKPLEEKCQKFLDLRKGLKRAGHRIGGSEMVVLAAFADIDAPIQLIIEEIAEADDALKKKKGFGSVLGCGTQLRRLFASALVLQTYEEKKIGATVSQSSTIASIVVEQIITLIVLVIVVSAVSASVSSH